MRGIVRRWIGRNGGAIIDLTLLFARVFEGVGAGLRRLNAVRPQALHLDNFRLAQRLRMGLAAYLRHLEKPLRDDVARLFEISGLWSATVTTRSGKSNE